MMPGMMKLVSPKIEVKNETKAVKTIKKPASSSSSSYESSSDESISSDTEDDDSYRDIFKTNTYEKPGVSLLKEKKGEMRRSVWEIDPEDENNKAAEPKKQTLWKLKDLPGYIIFPESIPKTLGSGNFLPGLDTEYQRDEDYTVWHWKDVEILMGLNPVFGKGPESELPQEMLDLTLNEYHEKHFSKKNVKVESTQESEKVFASQSSVPEQPTQSQPVPTVNIKSEPVFSQEKNEDNHQVFEFEIISTSGPDPRNLKSEILSEQIWDDPRFQRLADGPSPKLNLIPTNNIKSENCTQDQESTQSSEQDPTDTHHDINTPTPMVTDIFPDILQSDSYKMFLDTFVDDLDIDLPEILYSTMPEIPKDAAPTPLKNIKLESFEPATQEEEHCIQYMHTRPNSVPTVHQMQNPHTLEPVKSNILIIGSQTQSTVMVKKEKEQSTENNFAYRPIAPKIKPLPVPIEKKETKLVNVSELVKTVCPPGKPVRNYKRRKAQNTTGIYWDSNYIRREGLK